MNKILKISYYTDVLCFWAYAAQIRVDKLQQAYSDKIVFEQHFISVFGDTENRIGSGWCKKGGYEGFADHLRKSAAQFPYLNLHEDMWTITRPKTSAMSHLFIKALQILEKNGEISPDIEQGKKQSIVDGFIWRTRCAFFEQGRDISQLAVMNSLVEELSIPHSPIERVINNCSALASLMSDIENKEKLKLEGSPSYVMNEGRQKLYGNVGYKIIEANIVELFERDEHQLSWC